MAKTDDEDEAPKNEATADGGEAGEEGGAPPKKKGRKKLFLFGGIGVAVIAIAGVAAFMLGLGGGGDESQKEEKKANPSAAKATAAVFYDLPEMLVNLTTDANRSTFLKVTISLELKDGQPETMDRMNAMLPRILDNFQVYLRELRLDDLNGSAGLFRLKEELLTRINRSVQPVQVTDVLFRELLVQ